MGSKACDMPLYGLRSLVRQLSKFVSEMGDRCRYYLAGRVRVRAKAGPGKNTTLGDEEWLSTDGF